jgi:toxin-antitoxin system PIN domain toxin
MAVLLDVNALIALVDRDHVGHRVIQDWFLRRHGGGWATCPLTENGMVRILSQPAYPSGQRRPVEVLQILSALKNAFRDSHEFWTDDISISDNSVFDGSLIAGAKQVTDVYLLGLAAHNKGTFASFDRSLTWRAVRGATPELVEALPAQFRPDWSAN